MRIRRKKTEPGHKIVSILVKLKSIIKAFLGKLCSLLEGHYPHGLHLEKKRKDIKK